LEREKWFVIGIILNFILELTNENSKIFRLVVQFGWRGPKR
jgi:hypothetical protein